MSSGLPDVCSRRICNAEARVMLLRMEARAFAWSTSPSCKRERILSAEFDLATDDPA